MTPAQAGFFCGFCRRQHRGWQHIAWKPMLPKERGRRLARCLELGHLYVATSNPKLAVCVYCEDEAPADSVQRFMFRTATGKLEQESA